MHNYVHTLENYIIKKVCVLCAESLQWYLTLCNPMVHVCGPNGTMDGEAPGQAISWL